MRWYQYTSGKRTLRASKHGEVQEEMAVYPRLTIDIAKIRENAQRITTLCAGQGIEVCGVTKDVCGDPVVAQALVDGGVALIGDSRLADLERMSNVECKKLLLRAPQKSDAAETVRLADISINTELSTLKLLEEACVQEGIESHGVLLMCDLGDLREGFVDEAELMEAADYVAHADRLYLYGIGANLNCLSFILPDRTKMEELAAIAEHVKERTGVEDLVVSGGNSTNLRMLLDGDMPAGITQLRLGEGLLFGRERATYEYLDGTRNDAFIFQTQIIELKEKPSKPWGTSGADSYGNYHEFEDHGTRLRAIVAFGHQDCEAEIMWPVDEGVEIVDSASDHTVLDLTDSKREWAVGDVVELRCGYHAVARACISPYVEKTYR